MTIRSFEDDSGLFCVDVEHHADAWYSVKVFRRDPEDQGRWTLVSDRSAIRFRSEEEALESAAAIAPWLCRQR